MLFLRWSSVMLVNVAFFLLSAVLTCSASRNQFNEVDFFDKMRGNKS